MHAVQVDKPVVLKSAASLQRIPEISMEKVFGRRFKV